MHILKKLTLCWQEAHAPMFCGTKLDCQVPTMVRKDPLIVHAAAGTEHFVNSTFFWILYLPVFT